MRQHNFAKQKLNRKSNRKINTKTDNKAEEHEKGKKRKIIIIPDPRVRVCRLFTKKIINYRKQGSASYIVREVLSVREREREREIQRERERERERETEVTSPLSR